MSENKTPYMGKNPITYLLTLLKIKYDEKVSKEYKTGSTSQYKVLSDNNLTDELVSKIQNAGDSSFTGNFSDLTGIPTLDGTELKGNLTKEGLSIASKSEIPTNNNQLENGAGYQTASQVNSAIEEKGYKTETEINLLITEKGYQTATEVNTAITSKGYQTASDVTTSIANAIKDIQGIKYSIVASLPTTGEAGVIYLISNSGANPNAYDEYIWITDKFEKIGTTEVDLTGYLKQTDLVEITNDEIDAMMADW